MSEEFIGIHLLYLNSKILAWRVVSGVLVVGFIFLTCFVAYQENEVKKMRYIMGIGDHVTCDDGYIAKVVDGGKVTCLMYRTAPGAVTFPKDGSYLRKK